MKPKKTMMIRVSAPVRDLALQLAKELSTPLATVSAGQVVARALSELDERTNAPTRKGKR